MPQLKRVPQRTADFFIIPVWEIPHGSIDEKIEYLCDNDEHPTNCPAFVTKLHGSTEPTSSLADEVRMLNNGRYLVFTNDDLDEGTKDAIEFISNRHADDDLVFAYYGGLGQYAKLLTDDNGFRPLDCDFEVVELSDGTEVYFLETEKTETFNGH